MLAILKMKEIGIYGVQNQHFWVFFRNLFIRFSKLNLMIDIKRLVKVIVLDLQGKLLLCLNWQKWVIYGPKINTFQLSLLIRFFLKLHLMLGINLMTGLKRLFWILKGNSYYSQKGGNWSIFDRILKLFLLSWFIRFFWFS